MRILTVVAAAVLAVAVPSGATHLESRTWDCSSVEKVSVTGLGKRTDTISGMTISTDALLNYTLVHPDAGTYTGALAEKGPTKFVATPSASSLEDFEAYLVDVAESEFGIADVNVQSFVWKIAGKVDGDGGLAVKAKATAKGTGVVSGRTRKGKVNWKAKVTGVQE